MSWRETFGRLGGHLAFSGDTLGVPSTGAGTTPGTGGGQNAGTLEPNTRAANMAAGVPYQLVPSYPPFIRVANSPEIVYFPRTRTVVGGGNGVAAGAQQLQFYFSVPTIIVARSAAAWDASGAGLPVGLKSLNTFRAQMFRAGSQSDLIDAGGGGNQNPAVNVMGSAVWGTAAQPFFFPGTGLFVDNGAILNITLQTVRANIEVFLTLWCIEEYGPSRG